MKKYITILFSVITAYATAQSKQKFDVIVGVHSGVFLSTYQSQSYGFPNMFWDYNANAVNSKKNFDNENGFVIPVNAEVLFDVYGFRFGGKFEYTGGLYYYGGGQHSFTGLGTVEYGIKLNKNWVMAPAFSAGACKFNYMNDLVFWREHSLQNGYVLKGGLNFEMGTRQATFTVSPTYTFYKLKPKWSGVYRDRCHMYGLNMGVRFHLLRPKQ